MSGFIQKPCLVFRLFLFVLLLGGLSFQQTVASSTESSIATQLVRVKEAVKEKEYAQAKEFLTELIQQDSTFQEDSGRSLWDWLATVYEKEQKADTAAQILIEGYFVLKNKDKNDPYLNYHLVRLFAENNFTQAQVNITEIFYDWLKSISPERQPDLWEQFFDQAKILLFEDELQNILKEKPPRQPEIGNLFYKAFRRQDPTPATLDNEYVLQFFKRAAIARQKFSDPLLPKGYDDRGDIFILLGPTSRMYISRSGTRGTGGYALYPFEMWFYKHIHPDIYWTFVGRGGKNFYRLVSGPEEVLGIFYRGRTAFYGGRRTVLIPLWLRYDLYTSLAPLHREFRERIRLMDEQIDPLEANEYARTHFKDLDEMHFRWMKNYIRRLVLGTDFGMDTLTVFYNWMHFKGESGKTLVEFNYYVPNDEIQYVFEPEFYSEIKSQIGIFDPDYRLVEADSTTIPISHQKVGDTFISKFTFLLDPGTYQVIFRVENPLGERLHVQRVPLRVPWYPDTMLTMSEVFLVGDVLPTREENVFVKDTLMIIPQPINEHDKTVPLKIYFEVYNLGRDADGKAHFDVSYNLFRLGKGKNIFKKLFGWLGSKEKKPDLVLSETHHEIRSQSNAHVAWEKPVDNLKDGKYLLTVKVTDLVNETHTGKELQFLLIQ
ncbi:MAG: GWxTD domain-containing protein [Calditrichaeota bacterium]|nr:GWxTD domain-containing protein [Calditrichota bacterium]